MPSKTMFAATLIGTGLLAACAGGPRTSAVPAGLTYECEPGGLATINFNGGGYLPDSRVWGTNDKGERVQIPRSGAELVYDGRAYAIVAEVASTGLRYRSAAVQDGNQYLVWSMGTADGPAGAEDAALTVRSDPRAGEPAEREIARCARSGRTHSTAAPHRDEAAHGAGDTHRP